MKVILIKNVEKLGKKFDVKEVAHGFTTIVLCPRALAKPVTEAALKELKTEKEKAELAAELDLKKTEEMVAALDGQEIEIQAKIGDDGNLFGSITTLKLLKALEARGFDIKKKQIKLEEPIKETGEHEVTLELDHGLEARIKVVVTEEIKEEI